MERQPVESSMLKSVGYDPSTKKLHVEFSNGGTVYEYAGVSQHDFDALMSADSKGGHFARHIKGKFDHTKLDAIPLRSSAA